MIERLVKKGLERYNGKKDKKRMCRVPKQDSTLDRTRAKMDEVLRGWLSRRRREAKSVNGIEGEGKEAPRTSSSKNTRHSLTLTCTRPFSWPSRATNQQSKHFLGACSVTVSTCLREKDSHEVKLTGLIRGGMVKAWLEVKRIV